MKLLDTVALVEDIPALNLYRGQVGTIVEEYEPDVFEVEFSDFEGCTYALETLRASQLMLLRYQPSDDNHDSALVESTKVPSSGRENIILNKKTLFGIDGSWDFIEIPPTPLSEFMQTTFGITDENTAIDKLNQIQSQAYGDLNSDAGEDGEWVVSGKMYNLQKREVCEDAFWDMIDIVEDIRSTGVARDITTQQTVQQLSSELGVPESMFRHVFRVLAFDMCGGSSDDMPHCNKEGYFVFPKPIMNLKRR